MTKHTNCRTSVSALMGESVMDEQGHAYGRIGELAVSPEQDTVHVFGMIVRHTSAERKKGSFVIPIAELNRTAEGMMQLRENAAPVPLGDEDAYLLLERDLLDQQIIDINGHKVVRVND